MAGLYGTFSLNFLRNLHTVFHGSYTNYSPTNNIPGFPFLHIVCNICYSLHFYDTHSNRCEVISHYGFYLHFLTSDIEYLFMCPLALCISLETFLIGLFVVLLLSYIYSLYILDLTPLSDIESGYRYRIDNIFSHSVSCLFILMMVSFAVQKISSLI